MKFMIAVFCLTLTTAAMAECGKCTESCMKDKSTEQTTEVKAEETQARLNKAVDFGRQL